MGSGARFVVRRRNSDRRLPALREFMDAPFSLSLSSPLGTTHPAQCSEKAKPTREDLGVTLYSGSHRCFERDFLFLSLSSHGNEQAFLSSRSYSMSAYAYIAFSPYTRRWRCVSFRISIFALYSVVGIERSKKFSKSVSSTFISYIRVCVYIYIYIYVFLSVMKSYPKF